MGICGEAGEARLGSQVGPHRLAHTLPQLAVTAGVEKLRQLPPGVERRGPLRRRQQRNQQKDEIEHVVSVRTARRETTIHVPLRAGRCVARAEACGCGNGDFWRHDHLRFAQEVAVFAYLTAVFRRQNGGVRVRNGTVRARNGGVHPSNGSVRARNGGVQPAERQCSHVKRRRSRSERQCSPAERQCSHVKRGCSRAERRVFAHGTAVFARNGSVRTCVKEIP